MSYRQGGPQEGFVPLENPSGYPQQQQQYADPRRGQYDDVGSRFGGYSKTTTETYIAPIRNMAHRITNWPNRRRNDNPQLSPDEAIQWFHPYTQWVWYFFCQMCIGILFSFSVSMAFASFPGPQTFRVLARSMFVAFSMGGTCFFFAEQIGGIFDIYHILMVAFTDVCFNRKWDHFGSPWLERFSVILKVIILFAAVVVGNFIGPLFTVVIYGGNVMTSDCVGDFQILCLALPQTHYVTERSAQTIAVLSHLMIILCLYIGWNLIKKVPLYSDLPYHNQPAPLFTKGSGTEAELQNVSAGGEENHNMIPDDSGLYPTGAPSDESYIGLGLCVGVGAFINMLMGSTFVGMGFDTFYWVVLSVYTGNRTQANVFAWPGLMADLLALIFLILYQLQVRFATMEKEKVQGDKSTHES